MNHEFENELENELEDIEGITEDAQEEYAPEEAEEAYDENYIFDESGDIVLEKNGAQEGYGEEDADEDADESDGYESEAHGQVPDADEDVFDSEAREDELTRVRSESTELEGLVDKALEILGISGEGDAKSKLIRFIAEEKGISENEFVEQEQKRAENDRAIEFYKRAQYNEMKAKHLSAIHKKYPHTRKYTDVEQLPNFAQFGSMCDNGVPPEQAYAATHVDEIVQNTVRAVKQETRNNKEHIHSHTTRGGKSGRGRIPPAELALWRDAHPNLSEREVIELYFKTL